MGLTILGTLTDGTQVTQITGDVNVVVQDATATTITTVASSTLSTSLLIADPTRKGFTLFNEGNRTAYVALGATAGTASFSLLMPGGSFYDLTSLAYTGAVSAAWNGNGATMHVTSIVS